MKVELRVDRATNYVHLEIAYTPPIKGGALCSAQGRQYERDVAASCKLFTSPFLDIPLNTQKENELGGCTAKQDVYLNFFEYQDIGVEVKRKTPDWMQMSIIPGEMEGTWSPTSRTRIPEESRALFVQYLDTIEFPKPPFFERDITYDEWQQCKELFKDRYYEVPDDTIARAYTAKKTHYIQLRGYGLYRTGDDPCDFGVPPFECKQHIRIRCKRHGKKDIANGKHIPSSVMMSLCPKLNTLTKSPFSLDNKNTFPRVLRLIR